MPHKRKTKNRRGGMNGAPPGGMQDLSAVPTKNQLLVKSNSPINNPEPPSNNTSPVPTINPLLGNTTLPNFNKPEVPPNNTKESVKANSISTEDTTSSLNNQTSAPAEKKPDIKQLINPSNPNPLVEEQPIIRKPLESGNPVLSQNIQPPEIRVANAEEPVANAEEPVANVNQILINAQKVLTKATEFVKKQKNMNTLQQGGSSSKHKMRKSKRILQKYRHKISVRSIRKSNKNRKYKSRIKKSKSLR
jgi:hypothetical protein